MCQSNEIILITFHTPENLPLTINNNIGQLSVNLDKCFRGTNNTWDLFRKSWTFCP